MIIKTITIDIFDEDIEEPKFDHSNDAYSYMVKWELPKLTTKMPQFTIRMENIKYDIENGYNTD